MYINEKIYRAFSPQLFIIVHVEMYPSTIVLLELVKLTNKLNQLC